MTDGVDKLTSGTKVTYRLQPGRGDGYHAASRAERRDHRRRVRVERVGGPGEGEAKSDVRDEDLRGKARPPVSSPPGERSMRGKRGRGGSYSTDKGMIAGAVILICNESRRPVHPAAGRHVLLMVAILLVGVVAYRQLPVSALPQVDYPTIQVADVLSRRQPGRDGLVGHRAARAAVRAGAGPERR